MVELNTLLGLPKDFDPKGLAIGNRYIIVKDRERAFPLHIAILVVDADWNFYGYAITHSAVISNNQTRLEFEVLSLFSSDQQILYRQNFLTAAKLTGEVK